MNNKGLLYTTGNYIQYLVINHNGKEYEKVTKMGDIKNGKYCIDKYNGTKNRKCIVIGTEDDIDRSEELSIVVKSSVYGDVTWNIDGTDNGDLEELENNLPFWSRLH